MKCKFCGRELEDDAVYCLHCGKRLDGKKPCPSCKALLPEDATFCGKCGARIAPEVAEEASSVEKAHEKTPEKEVAETQMPHVQTPEAASEEKTPEVAAEAEPEVAPEAAVEEAAVEEVKEEEITEHGVFEPDGETEPEEDGEEKSEEDEKAEEAEEKPEGEAAEHEKQEPPAHSPIWKKAVEIAKICFSSLAAIVGFIFTFCIGVSIKADGVTNVSLFDYFGKVYDNLDIISNQVDNTQSFALYIPNIIGTLIAVAALVCNFVFATITVVAIVRQYSFQNKKVNFIKPALKTFISYAVFASVFFALNAASSHALGANSSVYFNKVTLAALIIGGVAFGGYFACNTVLRLHDFTDKKEIIKSSVALGTGVFGIVIVTLLTFPVCRFSTATHSYSLGLMSMVLQSAFELSDGTNCGGVMCFGIIGFAAQVTLLVLTVCVIIAVARRIGSGYGKMPVGVTISAAVLSVVFFFGVFAAANMLNAEAVPDSVTRSYGVPITVIVFSFIMLGGLIATIVLDNIYKRKPTV